MAMEKFVIFIVEDNEWYLELLSHNLSLNPDYTVRKFVNAADYLNELHEKPDVVTLDYFLPDMEGAELLKKTKEISPDTEVIVISEQENIQVAVDLLKNGAYDYIVKSSDIRNRLMNTVRNIREKATLRSRIDTLQREVGKKYSFARKLLGTSDKIKAIYKLIEKATTNNITVIVTGETGTGKELVAKAIHYNSNRSNKPFVAVNMAAIPAELVESEIFGHEKGAFTGAQFKRIGRFEEADKGTLFLDEIGEMDLNLQAKLLRVLQEKELTRVGGNQVIKTDCRIIVATNLDLLQEVKKGRFREDLYFRLFGIIIEIPPLRERGKDILILAKHFIHAFCKENEMEEPIMTDEAQKKLMTYSFPGNVRELKSAIELATVMCNDKQITATEINFSRNEELFDPMAMDLTLKEHTERIVRAYLQKYNDNIKAAADALDISYSTIYRMFNRDPGEE